MYMEPISIRVLLVDDSLVMLWGLSKLIQGEFPRMTLVGTACTATEALVFASLHPHVILLDLELDGVNSLEIIPEIRRRSGGKVLIHTGLDDRRRHEEAFQLGAMGVVKKGEPAETLLQAIECIYQGRLWHPPHEPLPPRNGVRKS